MYIKVNNHIFNDAKWSVCEGTGELEIRTDETISDLEQVFDPAEATIIEQYDDNDQLYEKWFNRDLNELSYKKENSGWYVVAKFKVSAIDNDSEAEIRENINDDDDAIIELAGMFSELEESVEAAMETFNHQHEVLNRVSELYNNIADRVAALENK